MAALPARSRLVWLAQPAAWWVPAGLIGLLWLTAALYAPALGFGLLWDDPQWFGRAAARNGWALLAPDPTFQFYRPGALLYNRLFVGADGVINAPLLHLAEIAWHLLNITLVYTLGRRSGLRPAPAVCASALFALCPLAQQAVAWAAPQQPLALALQNAAWLAFLLAFPARPGRTRRALALSYLFFGLALVVQESTVALAGMPLVLGLARRPTSRRVWLPAALGYVGLAALFTFIWLVVPRQSGFTGLYAELSVLAYLTQGLVYPVWGNVWGYPAGITPQPLWLLVTSAGVTLLLVALAWRHGWGRPALVGLAWAGLSILPPFIGLRYDYVSLSPRLLYYAAAGVAWLWVAGLWPLRRGGGVLILALILWQSSALLRQAQTLYAHGASHLQTIVGALEAAGAGETPLFLNVPDRYAPRHPPYPLGYWGLTLAPIALDLAEFAPADADTPHQTLSYALPWLDQAAREGGPYQVDMRGVIITPEELAALAPTVDSVFISRYTTTGAFNLERAGRVVEPEGSGCGLAQFGTVACLQRVVARPAGNRLHLHLTWERLDEASPHLTVFVHLGPPDQPPLSQADGDAWRGALPARAWPLGLWLEDERSLPRPPGDWREVRVGLYDWTTGERLPVVGPDGSAGGNWFSYPIPTSTD